MDYPKEHWPQIASTNPLERVNKEIKRRADVPPLRRRRPEGRLSASSRTTNAALIRLVGARMPEPSDERAVSRRYFSLESLARLADTHPRQLPAVAG